MHYSDRRSFRKVRRLAETLDQHFGQHPYLPRGMLTWRSDDIYASRRWMACHDRHKRARRYAGRAYAARAGHVMSKETYLTVNMRGK